MEKANTVQGPTSLVSHRKPHRRLLAVRPQLGRKPAEAGGVRHRVRQRHRGREGRADLRGDGLVGPRPGQPRSRHAPARRHPRRASLDRVRRGHDHKP